VSVFMFLSYRAAQLYPPALSSILDAYYDSQGYGRGNLTRLHTETAKATKQTPWPESASELY
jgi:hypothetical protein